MKKKIRNVLQGHARKDSVTECQSQGSQPGRRGDSEAAGLDDSLDGGWVGRLSSTEIENTG